MDEKNNALVEAFAASGEKVAKLKSDLLCAKWREDSLKTELENVRQEIAQLREENSALVKRLQNVQALVAKHTDAWEE